MRPYILVFACPALIGSVGCSRDQIAPDCFFKENGRCIVRDPGDPPGELDLDCGAPPLGAVGANYNYTVDFSPMDGVVFSAANLPPGLTIGGTSGQIIGVPEQVGTYEDIVITMTGEDGASVMDTCDPLQIDPALDHDLYDLPPTAPLGCLPLGEAIGDHLGGGDGTAVVCTLATDASPTCPHGNGNGILPAGVTFDAASCTATGAPTEDRFGTWVWMVDVEQSGRHISVPFCATNADPPFHAIATELGGAPHDPLAPAITPFDPAAPLVFGSNMDPRFSVVHACPGNDCNNWGYKFVATCSGFDPPFSFEDDGSLDDGMGGNIGFFHHLTASTQGATVESTGLGERAWVVNFQMWYCTAPDAATCDGDSDTAIYDNAQTKYTWSVIAYPQ
jgi:hypothetical protein